MINDEILISLVYEIIPIELGSHFIPNLYPKQQEAIFFIAQMICWEVKGEERGWLVGWLFG